MRKSCDYTEYYFDYDDHSSSEYADAIITAYNKSFKDVECLGIYIDIYYVLQCQIRIRIMRKLTTIPMIILMIILLYSQDSEVFMCPFLKKSCE